MDCNSKSNDINLLEINNYFINKDNGMSNNSDFFMKREKENFLKEKKKIY